MADTTTQKLTTNLKKILEENHPVYDSMCALWKLYVDAYKGGAYVKNYIYQHVRESDDSVKKRRNKATYPNYIRPIVSLYLNYIYRRTITRKLRENEEESGGKEKEFTTEVQKFWDDCDGKGTPINKFMKRAGSLAKVFGHVGILVDMPVVEKDIESEEERQTLNHRPYLALYTPVDIVNWEVDNKGNLLWVRVREETPSKTDAFIEEKERDRRPKLARLEELERIGTVAGGSIFPSPGRESVFFSRKGIPVRRYTTWTQDEWITYDILPRTDKRQASGSRLEVVEVAKGKHNIGEVPIVFLYHENDPIDPVVGLSFLQDIAPLNILIMNWLSLLDEEITQKTLNILTMPDQGDEEIVIGSNNVLTYTGDTAPQFLSPSATPGEMIQTAIEKARDEIYRLAKLSGGVAQLKEVRSGVAYSYEFSETEQTLADTADELEAAEEKIHTFYMKWMDKEWEGTIDYPEEFGIEDVLADLKVLEQSIVMVSSPTFKSEVQKKIVGRIIPKTNEDIKKVINEEIEAMIQQQTEQMLKMQQGGTQGEETGNENQPPTGEANQGAESQAGQSGQAKEII